MSKAFIAYHPEDHHWVQSDLEPILLQSNITYFTNQAEFDQSIPSAINIKRAFEKADLLIFVLSNHFVKDEWPDYEAVLPHFIDKFSKDHQILSLFIQNCKPPRKLLPYRYFDLTGGRNYDKDFASLTRLLKQELGKAASKELFGDQVYLKNFTPSVTGFIGRRIQLNLLDQLVYLDHINIINVFGEDGMGKSTLVAEWINQFIQKEPGYYDKVFCWSFNGNARYEDPASALDSFFKSAFAYFGYFDAIPFSQWDQGQMLARIIREHKVLLVLDGLEVFDLKGFKNNALTIGTALYSLIGALADTNRGLCILISRFRIENFDELHHDHIEKVAIDRLNVEESIQLLQSRISDGSVEEISKFANGLRGKPLNLNLFLAAVQLLSDGNLSQSYKLNALNEHLSINEWLDIISEKLEDTFLGNFLNCMALFDSPVSSSLLKLCLDKPVVGRFNHKSAANVEKAFSVASRKLQNLNLLFKEEQGNWYLHPLVWAYYQDHIRLSGNEDIQKQYQRLYKYYKSIPENRFPETLDDMKPLMKAIKFACLSGKHAEVYQNIYSKKITRDRQYFVLHRLKGHAPFLSMVSAFYDQRWNLVSKHLKPAQKSAILGATSYVLKYLGRFNEAVLCMQHELESQVSIKDWKDAALNAESISDLYVLIGKLKKAAEYAHMSLDFADLSNDIFHKWSKRCTYANTLFLMGKSYEAENLFVEAEDILKNENNSHLLYGMAGYNYSELLLSKKQYQQVISRTERILDWMGADYWQLAKGMDWLTLAKAFVMQALDNQSDDFSKAYHYLNKSAEVLSGKGYENYYPAVLLLQAELLRYKHEYKQAHQTLKQVIGLTEKGGMQIFMIEAKIELCRLYYAEGAESLAKSEFGLAKDLVERHGYFRRYPELKALKELMGL